jgi:AraC-like DNA-binding protein
MCFYIFLRFQDYDFRREFWLEVHKPFTYDLEFNLSALSLIFYLFYAIKYVQRYQKWIVDRFSNTAKIDLSWLRIMLITISILTAFWISDAVLRSFFQYYPEQTLSDIFIGLGVLILSGGSLLQRNLNDEKIEEDEEARTNLENADIDEAILAHIQIQMQEGKAYLNSELSLKEFASELNLSSRIVSFHINQGLHSNFKDFVNKYRVEAFKIKLKDSQFSHLSLLGMAYESGFNSKSTFNRAFKKQEQMTPSEYYQRVQNRN